MSIIEFKYYELDKAIDERIQQSNDIRNEWGTHIFDDEGRLQNSEDFPLDQYTLLGIVQYQQEQITDLEHNFNVAWKDLTHYKDECRGLTASDGVNSNAIEMLLERVKDIEKREVIDANAIDTIFDRLMVLENEMIDKDLRISKLEKEVEKL